jgi:Bacterial Ig domain
MFTQGSAMQNILSFKMRTVLQLLVGGFLTFAVTFANAQGYSGVQVTKTNSTYTFGVNYGTALGGPVRFALTNPVDTSDVLVGSGVQIVNGAGGVAQSLQIGPTSGVRVIRFCRDPDRAPLPCDPTTGPEIIHLGAVSITSCNISPATVNILTGVSATLLAGCTVATSANIALAGQNFRWNSNGLNLVNGLPSGTSSPAFVSSNVPGIYTPSVNPEFSFNITRFVGFSDTSPATNNPVTFGSVSATVNVTAAPTVSITSPLNNTTFTAPISNIPLLVATTAPPGTTITQVQYLLPSGVAISTSNVSPFTGLFGTKVAGSFIVTPRITLSNGVSADGVPVTIIVYDAPTISIATPANGAASIALAPIRLTANATSPSSLITKVEYFAGTTRIGEATTAPFAITWSPALPSAYSVTAVLTNQAGETAVSAPVAITVNAPSPADVLCAVAVLPKSIKVGEAVTLQAVCKRNGILIAAATLPSPESVSYEWRAGAGSPPIATATTSDTVILPKTTFTRSGFFAYQVVAKLTNPQFPTASATSNTAEGIVEVKSSATRIDVITAPGSLRVLPGEVVNFTFRVLDGTNPVPGQEVKIAIIGGNVKRAAPKAGSQKAFSNCAAQDVLAQQSVTTNNNGEGTVSFTAGCATGGRTVLLSAGSVTKDITLNGPDQLAQALALLNGASMISAEPGKPTPVSVKVIDSNNTAVASSTTKWTINPIAAATVMASAVSNAEGIATTTVTLNPGFKSAQLEVCIDGSASGTANKCKKIQVLNSVAAVVEPATAMTQATIQQAVDAPRVQLNNIRNRLQQLRVEEMGSGTDRGGSDKRGDNIQAAHERCDPRCRLSCAEKPGARCSVRGATWRHHTNGGLAKNQGL